MRKVRIVDHPLIKDKISRLRDKTTGTEHFRQLVHQVSIMLAVEATAHCQLLEVPIDTPFERLTGYRRKHEIVLLPILRAGLGMLDGFLSLLPDAKIGYLGVYRDEVTLAPVSYYKNLPKNLNQSEIFMLDPMLATGGSANYCLSLVKQIGGQHITLVTIVSAPEGVALINQNHPDVTIVTASLDRGLNGHGYIVPGLGDAGDRLNGTL